MSYNRYKEFTENDNVKAVPFIKLSNKITDKTEIYKIGVTRIDLLSYKYYNDANYGWLILLANPNLGSLEFNIKNSSQITIPYPLNESLEDYKNQINKYKKYYEV